MGLSDSKYVLVRETKKTTKYRRVKCLKDDSESSSDSDNNRHCCLHQEPKSKTRGRSKHRSSTTRSANPPTSCSCVSQQNPPLVNQERNRSLQNGRLPPINPPIQPQRQPQIAPQRPEPPQPATTQQQGPPQLADGDQGGHHQMLLQTPAQFNGGNQGLPQAASQQQLGPPTSALINRPPPQLPTRGGQHVPPSQTPSSQHPNQHARSPTLPKIQVAQPQRSNKISPAPTPPPLPQQPSPQANVQIICNEAIISSSSDLKSRGKLAKSPSQDYDEVTVEEHSERSYYYSAEPPEITRYIVRRKETFVEPRRRSETPSRLSHRMVTVRPEDRMDRKLKDSLASRFEEICAHV